MIRNSKKKNSKRKKYKIYNIAIILFIVLTLVLSTSLFLNSFAINDRIESISFTSNALSYNNNEPGSFRVEKSAKWIGKQSAKITFEIDSILKATGNYQDIILIVDISENMEQEELNSLKDSLIDFVNSILLDNNNKIALLTFQKDKEILLDFTNDKTLLVNEIQKLTTMTSSNYYSTFLKIDELLNDYNKVSTRDANIIFVTDGYPNEGTPNEKTQYKFLKNQYKYLKVSGIQYETGKVTDFVKDISDTQIETTIEEMNNALLKASQISGTYNNFVLTDYINGNYFEVDSVDAINATTGNVSLEYEEESPKVIWNIPVLKTGFTESLTIDITLKSSLLNKGGNYSTNTKETVYYKIGDTTETVTSSLTPILEDSFIVQYDGNSPSDCTSSNIPSSFNKSVYQTVEISNNIPTCNGYQFKGWKIITPGVEKVNDNYFIMPESNVVLRAEWGKKTITKKLDGTVMPATPATATKTDILEGKTAWVDGIKLTGTIPSRGNSNSIEINKILLNNNNLYIRFPYGYYSKASTIDSTDVAEQYITYNSLASILGLTSEKIVSGQTILGVTGTYTSDATATNSDILSNETAYANGKKLTGTIANKGNLNWTATTGETKTVQPGYYTGGTLDSTGTYSAGYNAALNGKTLKMLAQGGTSISYTATEPMVVVIGGWIGGLSGKTNNVTASVTRASTGTTTNFSRTSYDKGSNKGAGSYVNEVVSLETGDSVKVTITTTSSSNNFDTWIIGYN